MSDLISRQAAIEALIRKIRPHNNGDGTITMCVMSEELVRKTLDDLPSAQPDIIACGDCIHWICHDRRCRYWNHSVKPLDWCCHAERKTDE